jgi:hypothetical protein
MNNRNILHRFSLRLFIALLPIASPTFAAQPPADHLIPVQLSPLEEWDEKAFQGNTVYSIISTDGKPTLKASSQSSASMLYKKVNIDLNKTPFLNWQWKTENIFPDINEKTKGGDDYSARIYIAVKGKTFSLYPRAINYVWASTEPKNTYWKNPYSNTTIMIAKQSGDQQVNQWVSERVNLQEDLKKHFNKTFDHIKGIAIMTDTDNANNQATAFYKNIFFSQ